MKKLLVCLLGISLLLTACAPAAKPKETYNGLEATASPTQPAQLPENLVDIRLDGESITVSGAASQEDGAVFISRDIVYYEEKTHYKSGNPYGEGETSDMHSAEEAAAHLVVNITRPGSYRLRGNLDLGQIRVDLGEDAKDDPAAVVNLILDGVKIRCTVAPAIVFLNVYECDGDRTEKNATPDVDTSDAGANLFLTEDSENTVSGSYVAKIYKDKDGEKKLWKQDGAVYSYMSMNVYGPGGLNIIAENEGLDTEMHLTIHGGDIRIQSGNDGINTNEDGISVTTILGGSLHITAGLGEEGDGIDSNGYLVIRGGTVISSAHPASDAGLDSDLGSFIHGGTVIALGSAMDWAESDSEQVTMNLQFANHQTAGSSVVITRDNGEVLFAYDPKLDEALGENLRAFSGAVISCPGFAVGDSCRVILGAEIEGTQNLGIFDPAAVKELHGGLLQAYTGTDVMRGPGGFDPFDGQQRPQGDRDHPGDRGDREPPEGFTMPQEGMEPPQGMQDNFTEQPPEGMEAPPDGQRPEGPPQGDFFQGQMPPEGFDRGVENTIFYLQDMVNFFSGLIPAQTVSASEE